MSRPRQYADAADRQRAYRARQQQALRNQGKNVRRDETNPAAPVLAPLAANQSATYFHLDTPGLLLRIDGELDDARVLATVIAPGATHLQPRVAYPFRRAQLAEVSP